MGLVELKRSQKAQKRNKLEIYDEVAANWWSDDVRWVRTLKNMVPARLHYFDRYMSWAGMDVLDLGCAGGFMAEAMTSRGALVTGIDPAFKAVEAAKAHAKASGLSIHYVTGIGESLPFANAQFDGVVCVDVLEHVQDLNKVLSEVSRILKPGGIFAFDTINRNAMARFITITMAEDLLRLLPKGTHDPNMFIRPAELIACLANAGLRAGPITGLGPIRINMQGDLVFGIIPVKSVIYAGVAWKAD